MPSLFDDAFEDDQPPAPEPPAPERAAPEPAAPEPAAPKPPARTVYTVSELTAAVARRLEKDFFQVWLEGEISNARPAASGHLYFTLKDDAAQIKAVMFRSNLRLLRFKPADGQHVIARGQLGLGAGGFGLLSASFGIGAIVGAVSIPGQLHRQSMNRVVTSGGILWALAIFIVALTVNTGLALIGTACAGAAWVYVFATLSAGTQSSAPGWVRARAVSMNLVATQGCLALGSAIWGVVASGFGTRWALATSASAVIILQWLYRRVRVEMGQEADVIPGMQLPELTVSAEPLPDDGPVLIQLEYRIDADNRDAFLKAIQRVGPTRRRNGATSWRVFRDVGEDGRFVERYVIASWAEYVRLRARMTMADSRLQQRVAELQRADVPIRVSRLIGVTAESSGQSRVA